MKYKEFAVLIVASMIMFCSFDVSPVSNVSVELTEENQLNVEAFIEAQEYLGHDTEIVGIDGYHIYISSVNGYGKELIYDFDCRRNKVLSVSDMNSNSNRDIRRLLSHSEMLKCSYGYDETEHLTSVTLPYAKYEMEYDDDGLLTNQLADGISLISKKYDNGKLIKTEYANGDYFEYEYDDEGNKLATYINGRLACEYEYNGNLISNKTDYRDGTINSYYYDDNGKLISMENDLGLSISYRYDDDGKIEKRRYFYDDIQMTITAGDGGISSNLYSTEYVRDISDRTLERYLTMSDGCTYSENYQYVVSEPEYDSLTESTFDAAMDKRSDDTRVEAFDNGYCQYHFGYDDEGKIVRIDDGTISAMASYNEFGELLMYDGYGGTYSYRYDEHGNIISYNYPYGGFDMEYEVKNGLDELVRINGHEVEYDENGNPTMYRDKEIKWQGKNMVKIDDCSFTYNDAGIRTSKTVGGMRGRTTHYFLEGNKVIFEVTDGDDPIAFMYENNEVIGMVYQGEKYFYVKNLQRDVTDIIDSDGNVVVSYAYDPWGTIVEEEGGLVDTIGKINPYRYRSYRYDEETGFYYLLTRYYDPGTGRFLNPDDISNLEYTMMSSTSSKNLYAYADNDPIGNIDPHGKMAHSLLNALSVMYSSSCLLNDMNVGPICLVLNGGGIYKGFHETAQLVAAKQLFKKGYISLLEYPVGNKKYADICACKGLYYLYEVKPITCSHKDAKNQLDGYLSSTGFLSGESFDERTIDFLKKIKMEVYCEEDGIIKYTFYKEKRQLFNKVVLVEVNEERIKKKLMVAYWVGVAMAGAIIVATLVEDVVTGGAGVADDVASIQVAAGAFRLATAFAMALV